MENNKIQKFESGQLRKISNVISLTDRLLGIDYRSLNIIHLDDHSIVRQGLKKLMLEKFPNLKITGFSDNSSTLSHLKNCLHNEIIIDFIITDLSHPGGHGIELAYAVRLMERDYRVRIPIILLTIQTFRDLIRDAIDDCVVDAYFPKDKWSHMIEYIRTYSVKV